LESAELEVEEAEEQPLGDLEEDVTFFDENGPETEEPGEGEEEAEEEDASAPTAESPQVTPFAFRAHGKEIVVPGAVQVEIKGEDGQTETQVVMTLKSFNDSVQSRMPDPAQQQAKENDLQAQIEALSPAHNEDVIRAGVLLKNLDGLIALASEDPETALQALQNFTALGERWSQDAKIAILEANAGRQATQESSSSDDAKAQGWAEIITRDLSPESPTNFVEQTLSNSGLELPPGDVDTLKAWAWRNTDMFYKDTGGELVPDTERFFTELKHQVGLIQRNDASVNAEAVKAANEKKVKPKTVPPTRSAKGKPAGTGDTYVLPKDKDEYRKRMGRA